LICLQCGALEETQGCSVSESDQDTKSTTPVTSDTSGAIAAGETILRDRSFWGLAITQFLGAFNDNLYKQLMLLMAIPAAGKMSDDVQGYATTVFSLPFVLLSGFAGYLSDKFSKSKIIFLCKIAEIGITLLAVAAFLAYSALGSVGTWSVLFLMGVHSTFFGPGKYGILPELFRKRDLPRANGLILMSTFLAIILGVVTAGFLKDLLADKRPDGTEDYGHLWIGSLVCTTIAIVGTITSLFIRPTLAAQPDAPLKAGDLGVSKPIRELLWLDKPLLASVVVSSMFYVVAGVVMPTVNSLGKIQLGINVDTYTSILTGGLAIGIIVGAVLANIVLKKISSPSQVLIGTWGMIITLLAIGCWKPGGTYLLGYWGALIGLIATGMFAAVFIIPIQVFMQERPPAAIKGRMIGTMNFANFIGILIAGPLYQIFLVIATGLNWPVSSIFWMLAILLIPIALRFRLPRRNDM
jgi:acyl-[acyl-carrier-protein]-phospholipid O-acyltransferase/long-chain-fatty-acid--[acyl-carrier-protein] ligase